MFNIQLTRHNIKKKHGYTQNNYDQNDFNCTCRVMDKPVVDTIKHPDGKIQTRIRFTAVTNSSQYSSRKPTRFICEARGARQGLPQAGIYIHAELQEVTDKSYDESLKKKVVEKYNVFVVEHCHVVSIPDTKSNNETFTDLFLNLEEEVGGDKYVTSLPFIPHREAAVRFAFVLPLYLYFSQAFTTLIITRTTSGFKCNN